MRMSKTAMALSVVAGSFFIYCGQSAMQGPGGSGPVGTANGQSSGGGGTCCTPPAEKITVLAHGDFKDQGTPAPISTAGYREIIVYTGLGSYGCNGRIAFRADASSPFTDFAIFNNNSSIAIPTSQRVQVNGSDVQLYGSCQVNANPVSSPWVVAGVSN